MVVMCSDELSSDQINYAAIDTWASLKIYDAVKHKLKIGVRISAENCILDTPVALQPKYAKKPVAFGKIISINIAQ
jgi:ribonuclease D